MAHKAIRVLEKLHNVPHLITQESLDTIVSYLEHRNSILMDDQSTQDDEDENDVSFDSDTGVGFLSVSGALTYKPTGMQALCGGTSYMGLVDDMQDLIEAGCKNVVMEVDSGGGEAFSMMQTAAQLRQMAQDNGVKLTAYVDGTSASAAYGLSCAASEIVVNPDSLVGSVGVVVRLMNDSKQLEQDGIQRSFVYAGDSKIPYAEDGSFRPEFIADIQQKVDMLYSEFTSFVSSYRDIPLKTVVGTQAKTFMADDAISLGLADKKMTRTDFLNYIVTPTDKEPKQLYDGGVGENMLSKTLSFITKGKKAEMAEKETQVSMAEQLQTLQASFEEKMAAMLADQEVKLSGMASLLQAAQDEAAAIKAEAETKKTAERKASLSAVLAADKVEATFAAMASLDDASFSTVVSGMKASREVEKTNVLFQELGESTSVDKSEASVATETESEEMKILKAKYAVKK